MSSPKELPKIRDNLKNELIGEHALKHTQTEEKVVLPTQDQIEEEKKEKSLREEIEKFDDKELKKTVCLEKNVLPTKEQILSEKGTE